MKQNTKPCSKCQRELPLSSFAKDKNQKDGHQRQCRECNKAYRAEYYRANRERLAEDKKNRYAEDAERIKEKSRQYRETHPEQIAKYKAEYSKKNGDKIAISQRKKYEKSRGKIIKKTTAQTAQRRRGISRKKELFRQGKNTRLTEAEILHMLRAFVSSSTRRTKTAGFKRLASPSDLLGCSYEELRGHIEGQFSPGMCWENWTFYGWHLDHIQPVASFDLSTLEEQKQCFHFSNLQPLWREQNQRKAAKTDLTGEALPFTPSELQETLF